MDGFKFHFRFCEKCKLKCDKAYAIDFEVISEYLKINASYIEYT